VEFRIADTFTAGLARLNGAEQKAVKTTAFDLQLNLSSPGLRFHRLERPRDPNFWSVRVNEDVRLIVHRTPTSLLLCYVGHHDGAYAWAERRRIERHPTTGAAQLVELPERVEHVAMPAVVVAAPAPKPLLFAGIPDDALLGYGVPVEWLGEARQANEDTLFDIAERLPQEAAEALLNLATGTTSAMPERAPIEADPFVHPDAQRRFRVLTNIEELERALDFPWDKWAVFLHPAQRRLVDRDYNGPARISGSAGTGKTIVALHRAVALARRHPQARVLLTTFSKALANALRIRLRTLTGNEPEIADRIAVHPVTGIGYDLYTAAFGQPNIAPTALIETLLRQAAAEVEGYRFSPRFLIGEWRQVVDAWQLASWEDYRDVARLGRKTRIGGKQREVLWSIFERVRVGLAERKAVTWPDLLGRVTSHLAADKSPFDFVVVDEAQDVGLAELRFLAALAAKRPDGLFFAGDLGQRIFQQPFSWRSLGVDVRGRSYALRINYRTSHQIRARADRLLPSALSDVDGNAEDRRGTVSVFNGPPPTIETVADPEQETEAVAAWIAARVGEGVEPHEIGVFERRTSPGQGRGQASRSSGDRTHRQGRGHAGQGLDRHDASGEGLGVSRGRGHGLRRRGDPVAGAHRGRRRRGRSRRGLQYRAALALCRLYRRPRPPAGDRRRARLRVPWRSLTSPSWRHDRGICFASGWRRGSCEIPLPRPCQSAFRREKTI
jgi:hypothetical protein